MIEIYKAKLFKINDINQHICCSLCKGYLIDASTIIECLHSFCRSCLITYLKSNNKCPVCQLLIHKTKPIINVRNDITLQDLTYKLIPGLYLDEKQKRKNFFLKRKCEFNKSWLENCNENYYNIDFFSVDDLINIKLSYLLKNTEIEELNTIEKALAHYNRYLQCAITTNMLIIRKFLQKKFNVPVIDQVELYYMTQSLTDNQTFLDLADPIEILFYIHEIYIEEEEMPEEYFDDNISNKNLESSKQNDSGDNNKQSTTKKGFLKQSNRNSIASTTTITNESDFSDCIGSNNINKTTLVTPFEIKQQQSNGFPTNLRRKFSNGRCRASIIDYCEGNVKEFVENELDEEDEEWGKDLWEKVDKACRKSFDISPPSKPKKSIMATNIDNDDNSPYTNGIRTTLYPETSQQLQRDVTKNGVDKRKEEVIQLLPNKISAGEISVNSREMAETLLKLSNGGSCK